MTRRYFVPDLPHSGGLVALPNAETQHATRVMRIHIGDQITLFDGKGSEANAIVAAVSRNECHCNAESCSAIDREPARAIHLGIALPKPDRSREMVERLTEIGVKSVTPLVAQRTQRPPSNSLLEKLERGVVEACKQSGRNELLQIHPAQRATEFFAAKEDCKRLIAHPTGESKWLESAKETNRIVVVIGPEGGWTDTECRHAMDQGFEPVDLGKRIYRVETAATVIASVLTS